MDRAQPGAIDSTVRNYELGDALGQFSDGWVVPASEPTASVQRSDLDETAFTAFDRLSSSSSLTVTIGPGEAFVDGWLATDTSTDVGLAASTAGQTVVVSWNPDAVYDPQTDATRDDADDVVIDLESNVDDLDPSLPLWTFDTDDAGVTSIVDERQIGPKIDVSHGTIDALDAVLSADLTDINDRQVYNLGEGVVPQARLGGPASSLSTYPLAGSDLAADYATAADLSNHVAATNVHGVSTVAGISDVSAVESALSSHEGSTAVHGVGEVFDAADYDPEADTHSRYGDGEARNAVEAGNLSQIDGENNFRISFSNSNNWIEIVDQSGTREDLVTNDLFVDALDGGTWLEELSPATIDALAAADYNPEADTHSRYTDGEASSAAPVQSVNGQTGNVSISVPSPSASLGFNRINGSYGTFYQNTTGNPLFVVAFCPFTGDGIGYEARVSLNVNSVATVSDYSISAITLASGRFASSKFTVYGFVPDGYYYQVEVANGQNFESPKLVRQQLSV